MANEETEPVARENSSRRRLLFVAKLAVTVVAFVMVAFLADISEAVSLMRGQNMLLHILAGDAVLAQIALGAFRWRAVLMASVQQDAAKISSDEAFRLYYASIFFNAVLPGGSIGGDVMRVVSTRALGVTTSAAIHSVVLDRILTLAALLLIALPAVPLIWQSIGLSSTMIVVLAAVCGVAVIGWVVSGRIEKLRGIRDRAAGFLNGFWSAAMELRRRPLALLLAVVLAASAHIAVCLAAWILAVSLGVNLSLTDALMLMPLVFLASAIPISIGGWGVREVGAIGLLGLVGISSHEAVLVSLQLGVVSTLVSLPGGLIWLARNGSRRARATNDRLSWDEAAEKH